MCIPCIFRTIFPIFVFQSFDDMKMIDVRNLRKTFGKIKALSDISFQIEKGEFFGLLGPNGAGKTTTINILSTVMKPDQGQVSINGYDLAQQPRKCKESIGIVPQELALYEDLTALENLLFWGRLYGLHKSRIHESAEKLLHLFELHERRNSLIKTFSGGMKRRINIAAAMLHDPEILLMDEPTVGVDPQSRNKIYDVLEQFIRQGVTIVYTTHYMDEVEKLCSRIGIIDHGSIIARGTLEELRSTAGVDESIIIHFEPLPVNENQQQLKSFYNGRIEIFDEKLIFHTHDSSRDLPALIERCNQFCNPITHIAIERASLETVFLKLTGRKLRD